MRGRVGRAGLLLAAAAVVVVAVLAVPAGPATAQVADNRTTTFGFDVRADGDAQVSVTARLPLGSDADREGFDRLARAHTSGTDSPLSVAPFEQAAARSAEANGRAMAIQDVTRSASRTNETGRLSIRFTWTNFAEPEEEEGLAIGDVFRTPDGTWLPRLSADQELRISFPSEYSPQSISIPGTRYQLVNRSVRIEGPATFEPGTPAVVLQQAEPPAGPPWGLFTGAGVVVAVLAIGAYLFRDRFRSAAGSVVASGAGSADGGGSGDGDGTDAVEAAPAEGSDPVDEPLLSDEERVVELLSARGGRMKQVEIVEATDWSNAKVSQLLTEMEEDGRVDKLRIGRENLISLPGHGPGDES